MEERIKENQRANKSVNEIWEKHTTGGGGGRSFNRLLLAIIIVNNQQKRTGKERRTTRGMGCLCSDMKVNNFK